MGQFKNVIEPGILSAIQSKLGPNNTVIAISHISYYWIYTFCSDGNVNVFLYTPDVLTFVTAEAQMVSDILFSIDNGDLIYLNNEIIGL